MSRNLRQLRTLLAGDPSAAKAALSKHMKELVLTPEARSTGPVYAVSGSLDAMAGSQAESDVMLVVARDGIQQHYSLLSIPLTDVYLDPRLDLS